MALRALLGLLLGLVARVWLATLRVRVEVHPALADRGEAPWVLSFFHGTQWPLLAWGRRRRTVVMVSLSRDGSMQARALGVLGLAVVRGSSSRGGARGLAALVRRLKAGGLDAAFAVDGPRGPYYVVKPGAILAARAAGGLLVPVGAAVRRPKVFERAWDRFVLAWPFAEVAVVVGPPVSSEGPDATERLGLAIRAANARAGALLAGGAPNMVPSQEFSMRTAGSETRSRTEGST